MALQVTPASLDGSANDLLEVAGLLQAGRPELALTGRAKEPYAHGDVADATGTFASFAHDQYEDAVALFAVLSTRLASAAAAYQWTDEEAADAFLTFSTLQPAGERPR